jgi:NarL family two-component system response regulator LiaR
MPGMDGVDTTYKIKQSYPQIQIIALTSFQEKDMVERAIQAGAIGYLLKNVDAQELARAIRAAYEGRPTLSEEATEALIESTRQKASVGHDLTPREQEILILMSKGLTNKEIAEQLMISKSTVKYHAKGILSKLEAANRAEAVNIAWKHNLIPEQQNPAT